jgi:multisubunit Na+/H+ antiporter MnhC subunit
MKWSWVGATLIISGILVIVRPNLIEWVIGIAIIVVGVFYFIQAQR